MSHTPGPWRVEPSYENIPGGGELRAIGTSYQWPEGEAAFCALAFTPRLGVGPYAANREDDARLMAAAPELLAACKYISDIAVSWQPLTPGDIADVRRAIAKAEGR